MSFYRYTDVTVSATEQIATQGGDKVSTNFFSSLNGQFDLNSSMSSLYGDYNQIKSGAYGSLMKSYVNKVGNKAALNAYRETGSTTTGVESTTQASVSKKASSSSKSSFLDSYLKDATKVSGKEKSSSGSSVSSETTSATTKAATTTDKYASYKSSWLDDQLKQYDKDANKTTAADTSVAYDTTI